MNFLHNFPSSEFEAKIFHLELVELPQTNSFQKFQFSFRLTYRSRIDWLQHQIAILKKRKLLLFCKPGIEGNC
jgi:hypothetical protein